MTQGPDDLDALVAQTRLAYDTVAQTYAELLPDVSFEDPRDLALIDRLIARLSPGSHVLDAGCGAGRLLTHLARLEPTLDLAGIDLSRGMVTAARAAHPRLPIAQGDLRDLPYDDGTFDGILAWYSIIHTPPALLDEICDEFRRILSPRGSLLVAFQAGAGKRLTSRPYGHEVELRAFLHDPADVAAALVRAGFAPEAELDRPARATEKHRQGFVLARRR